MEGQSKYAPLVLFVYNRPDHVRLCLEAVNKNVHSDETDFYIFSDGAKNQKDAESVNEVRSLLKKFADNNSFKSVNITESNTNKGLAASVISGVDEVIGKYGRVIVLEDDLITSSDFLNFMNGALDYYERNQIIWSVAGYTPELRCIKRYKHDVWFCDRAGSWGWATWSDRWKSIDWNVTDYNEFINDPSRVKQFKKRGYNMPEMLEKQMNGEIDSWAIRFCYEQYKQDKVTVKPAISRIYNIGFDGTGTHGEVHNKWKVTLYEGDGNTTFIPLMRNRKINREYYYFEGQYPLIRFVRIVWKRIKTFLGIQKELHFFD